jgi:aspartate racemase
VPGVATAPLIGIVGGLGPLAGFDLARKICEETIATRDQDHLPVALLSYPHAVPDRSSYLLGEHDHNPALPIRDVIGQLEALGCRAVGVACHTAHAPAIWDVITAGLAQRGSGVTLLNMVVETARHVRATWPTVSRVGVLTTLGTQRAGVYMAAFAEYGLTVVELPEAVQAELVHASVYDPEFGIKAHANPVSEGAVRNLRLAVKQVRAAGAQVIVLACTELPLALPDTDVGGTPLVDATRVLARALIRAVAPERLRG